MQVIELRPMGIGDILDSTFKLYLRRFGTFLLIVLVAYVPYALLRAIFVPAPELIAVPGELPAENLDPSMLIGGGLMFLLFAAVIMPLSQGALIQNISASYLGERIGAGESYRRALPRLLRLLIANLLVGIIVAIGLILLVVPGIIFSLWFILTTAVVMLETHSATGSMGRSRELMRGNLGKGFVLLLVVIILFMVYGGIVGVLLQAVPWPSPFWATFVENLIEVPILPIYHGAIILLYYDLRIRKEGFDLQQLAVAVESAAGQAPATEQAPSQVTER